MYSFFVCFLPSFPPPEANDESDKEKNNKVVYSANSNHPLFSVMQSIVRKHLGIENIVEKKVDELVKEKLQDLVEKGDIEIKNKNLISSNQNSNIDNTAMEDKKIKIPHNGWNEVKVQKNTNLFKMNENLRFQTNNLKRSFVIIRSNIINDTCIFNCIHNLF